MDKLVGMEQGIDIEQNSSRIGVRTSAVLVCF